MFNFRKVKREQTGWRDEYLSRRHREWGFDCPMVDIDFLVTEYDKAEPVVLIEYKKEGARFNLEQANYTALRKLADRAKLPFFIVSYSEDLTIWTPIPVNEKAKGLLPQPKPLSELKYVELLYKVRGREVPLNIRHVLRE